MLVYRIVFRNLPRHILYRSLASDGPHSKKPPNLTTTKSENRITNIKDIISSFLLPKKSDGAKTSKLPETASNVSKIAALDLDQSRSTLIVPTIVSSSPGKSSADLNKTPSSSAKSPSDSKNASSSLGKTSNPPREEKRKEANRSAKNTPKPNDKKAPLKPVEPKKPNKSDDIKSPCLFPTKFDDPKPQPCKPEDEKPKSPPSAPPQTCKTDDTKSKCPLEEPPKPAKGGDTSCESNTKEPAQAPPCKTEDKNPPCLVKEPPKNCKSENITKICPPAENPATQSSPCTFDEKIAAFDHVKTACPPQEIPWNSLYMKLRTKNTCENVEICPPPAEPTSPPCLFPDCPEITRLEYLNDPCDPEPKEFVVLKEELQKRRCFECSTVQGNAWVDLSLTTGVPEEQLKHRTVIIAKSFKNVMQQGTDNTKDWELQWVTSERWQNPLMGWSSSADPLGNAKLSFATQLDAERWCIRNGWKYQVLPEREPAPIPPKSYASNFSWNRRNRVSTK